MATIGFIGLGNMGAPMAANLVKAQHHVTGFDVVAAPRAGARRDGRARRRRARPRPPRPGDIVITMLPAGPQVRAVYLGPDGVIARGAAGRAVDRLLDDRCRDRPRGRRGRGRGAGSRCSMRRSRAASIGAEAGTLTFMVGGDGGGLRPRRADPAGDGAHDRPCRPLRQRPDRQDLQQHDPRRLDDRGVRGFRAGREARARRRRHCSTSARHRPASAGR